jgi:hypothetical protein
MLDKQLLFIITLHSDIFSKLITARELLLLSKLNTNFYTLIKNNRHILTMIINYINCPETYFINNEITIKYKNKDCEDNSILFFRSSLKYSYSFMRVFKLNKDVQLIELKKFYYILIKFYNVYKELTLKELIKYLDMMINNYNKNKKLILT